MVEPQQEPGIIVFGLLTIFMVLSAGVSSLTPARDFRVFIGAIIQTIGWLLLLAAQEITSNFAITSSLFLVDILYLIAFYYLSKSTNNDNAEIASQRDWAGYVVAILAIMISIEMVHFVDKNDYFLENFVRIFFYTVGIILFFGFLRGFGMWKASMFALYIFAITIIGNRFYVTSSNVLSFLIIVVITTQALKGVKRNLKHWLRK